ncbi:MAG TPA: glycoside hydrolase family 15 protein, partial [Candidatus Polarisedimenticolia bacterium]|nr:glycoside hydrolase family 15 protein [Candidatus Polarisedimenticolia bacterium]
RTVPWVTRLRDGRLRAIAGPDMVTLATPVALQGRDLKTVGSFTVAAGDAVPFVLSHGPSHLDPPEPVDAERALRRTETFWNEWRAESRFHGGCSDPVGRSLITLKALTYAPTGGLVAAPTTSLPERLGGVRNWDYRFCWLRDATLTLLALLNAGHTREAGAWRDWLLRAAAGAPSQLQIMYGLGAERRLAEMELPWLPGYEGSRPVRLGNAAHDQLQLDVYGEVLDILFQSRRARLVSRRQDWAFARALVDHLAKVWRDPDHGLWEMRGPPRHFTFSKVMAWVAFDRAVRLMEADRLEGPLEEWRRTRRLIHEEVCARGFDRRLGSFVQAYGTKSLDASLLLIPTVGFLPPHDPRVRGTVAAIERRLFHDGFVRRYDTRDRHDGLPPGEGVFLACSFWLADAYVLMKRRADARRLYERLLALRNDVGLLSEEYDPATRRLVGNFPQAFSHIALINTAANLQESGKPAEQRSGHPAEPGPGDSSDSGLRQRRASGLRAAGSGQRRAEASSRGRPRGERTE